MHAAFTSNKTLQYVVQWLMPLRINLKKFRGELWTAILSKTRVAECPPSVSRHRRLQSTGVRQ